MPIDRRSALLLLQAIAAGHTHTRDHEPTAAPLTGDEATGVNMAAELFRHLADCLGA